MPKNIRSRSPVSNSPISTRKSPRHATAPVATASAAAPAPVATVVTPATSIVRSMIWFPIDDDEKHIVTFEYVTDGKNKIQTSYHKETYNHDENGRVFELPSNITALCILRKDEDDVLMGCEDGNVYCHYLEGFSGHPGVNHPLLFEKDEAVMHTADHKAVTSITDAGEHIHIDSVETRNTYKVIKDFPEKTRYVHVETVPVPSATMKWQHVEFPSKVTSYCSASTNDFIGCEDGRVYSYSYDHDAAREKFEEAEAVMQIEGPCTFIAVSEKEKFVKIYGDKIVQTYAIAFHPVESHPIASLKWSTNWKWDTN